jgi:adenylate kinase family enzyme
MQAYRPMHVHVTGASGSGTTSLGAALAQKLGVLHLDSDDFFWLPTDPPFTTPRARNERATLLAGQALPERSWILSGSALGWATLVEPLFDLIVFLRVEPALRMERLRQRELARYGARIQPGGDMVAKSREFMEWAASYDNAGPEIRSLVGHNQWLTTQTCPALWLDSSRAISNLVDEVLAHPSLAAAASHIRS